MAIDKVEPETSTDDPGPVVKKKKPYHPPLIWQASAARETETGINNGSEILILLS